MKVYFKICAVLLITLLTNFCLAQQPVVLQLQFDPPEIKHVVAFKTEFPDSVAAHSEVDRVVSQLRVNGFLLGSVAEIRLSGNIFKAKISAGPKYQFVKLKPGNVPPRVLSQVNFQSKFAHKTLTPGELDRFFEGLLELYENSGYPFASIELDSVEISGNSITASLNVNPHNLFVMDTIAIAGNANVSKKYLQTYLQTKTGSFYNESTVRQLDEKLNELNFVEVVKPTEVRFYGDKASATIFLRNKNANQFDGILGFQPNSADRKLEIIGDFRLQLQNIFKRAESLLFNYKGLPNQTRDLDLSVSLPNIFASRLNIGLDFNLFKQDTTFQNINQKIKLGYSFGGNNSFNFFIEKRSGSLINTSGSVNPNLPVVADIKTTQYGLELNWERLKNSNSPTHGFAVKVIASAGKRTAHNSGTSTPGSAQYQININAEKYFSLSKRAVFLISNKTGFVTAKPLFANELYRIGGLKTLRGFDEQSFFTDRFSVFNAEYRFLLEQNSFLFAFMNQGIVSDYHPVNEKIKYPLGVGSGINLETKAGIVSLAFAVGKQQNNPLDLRKGKIHLGLTALF